jgi:hypothetical protein
MKSSTEKRGGKRPGSGRPKGSTRGRNTVTCSISMPPDVWRRLDAQRGSVPRGKFIASLLA